MISNTNTSPYFQPNELEDLFETLKILPDRQQFKDEYDFFIWQCKQKTYPKDTLLEKHHILPKHAGGTNATSNMVSLSIKDHITSHWLRWKVYDSTKDFKAYKFRVSNSEERRQIQIDNVRKMQEENKKKGIGFNDPILQAILGKRGGSKGGSANTEPQFKALLAKK